MKFVLTIFVFFCTRTASERCRARSQLVRRQRTLVPAETRDAAAASPPSDAAASVGRNDGRIRRRHGHAVPPSQRRRTQFRRLWLPSGKFSQRTASARDARNDVCGHSRLIVGRSRQCRRQRQRHVDRTRQQP